jgi:hypothetical protein
MQRRVRATGTILFLSLLLAMSASGDELVRFVPWGRTEGKEFNFKVTDADLTYSPPWQPNASNPPLPPLHAAEIARKQLDRLVADRSKWRLRAITLRNVGNNYWVYVVMFDSPYRAEAVADGRAFYIPVLMNGSVPTPEVKSLLR